jgi:heme O synthase-like polyprenyltransferase
VPKDAIGVSGVALLSVALVFVLFWLVVRPMVARMSGVEGAPQAPGTAGAMVLVLAAVVVVTWFANPYAAALLVPAAHAWLLILAPGVRLRRGASIALLVAGLLPTLTGLAGPVYFFGALALGGGFLACGLAQALGPSPLAARRLLIASVLYLPLLLGLMALDKV